MGIVRCDVTVSLDGCMAASGQSLEHPFGEGGTRTMAWHGSAPDASPFTGTPNPTGAFVMGRNMFGPGRGEWDLSGRGWWGEEPAVHGPDHLTFSRVAEILSQAVGRQIPAKRISDDDFRSSLRSAGLGVKQIEGIVGMSAGLREDFVAEDRRSVLTTTPATLSAWAHAHLRPAL